MSPTVLLFPGDTEDEKKELGHIRVAVLKVWSLYQQHPRHLGTC